MNEMVDGAVEHRHGVRRVDGCSTRRSSARSRRGSERSDDVARCRARWLAGRRRRA